MQWSWFKALRIHQWAKNLLVFVPLALAHRYGDPTAVAKTFAGFLSLSAVASATYIFNDIRDLSADRLHPTKRNRPLASGAISERAASVAALFLGLVGFVIAAFLDTHFTMLLALYVILSVAYSVRLKAIALLDLFVLSFLFTLRILMGIALLDVPVSAWLLMFSMFFFFSLSTAKRHVEIVRAAQRGETRRIKARGYLVSDEPFTLALGISAGFVANVLLFLYVANDAYPRGLYQSPEWLFCIGFVVFLWTSRLWLKSHRGRLNDDPVEFALKDPPSLLLGLAALTFFLLATY